MKKITSDRKTGKAVNATAASTEQTPPRFTPRGVQTKNRIMIAVQDGKIDFAAMGAESAKTFNELMHNPDVQAQFGIGPLRDHFDPQHCKRIYEALGSVFQSMARVGWKWPTEAVEKLAYTEAEKEELSKPTATVLDELAPKWLRENQAVAALVLVFGAMTQAKLREAATIAAQHKAEIQRNKGLRVSPPPASTVPSAPTGTEPAAAPRKPINSEVINLGPSAGPDVAAN
jgi:hypothetical protein